MYAIVTSDYLKEYKGRNKKGERIFVERTVPHQGKRYTSIAKAAPTAWKIEGETGMNLRIVEVVI